MLGCAGPSSTQEHESSPFYCFTPFLILCLYPRNITTTPLPSAASIITYVVFSSFNSLLPNCRMVLEFVARNIECCNKIRSKMAT